MYCENSLLTSRVREHGGCQGIGASRLASTDELLLQLDSQLEGLCFAGRRNHGKSEQYKSWSSKQLIPALSSTHLSSNFFQSTTVINMSSPKTSWEDLARLGWPIYDVYKKANAARGGTMNGTGDISLNAGIAAEYQ